MEEEFVLNDGIKTFYDIKKFMRFIMKSDEEIRIVKNKVFNMNKDLIAQYVNGNN